MIEHGSHVGSEALHGQRESSGLLKQDKLQKKEKERGKRSENFLSIY